MGLIISLISCYMINGISSFPCLGAESIDVGILI